MGVQGAWTFVLTPDVDNPQHHPPHPLISFCERLYATGKLTIASHLFFPGIPLVFGLLTACGSSRRRNRKHARSLSRSVCVTHWLGFVCRLQRQQFDDGCSIIDPRRHIHTRAVDDHDRGAKRHAGIHAKPSLVRWPAGGVQKQRQSDPSHRVERWKPRYRRHCSWCDE